MFDNMRKKQSVFSDSELSEDNKNTVNNTTNNNTNDNNSKNSYNNSDNESSKNSNKCSNYNSQNTESNIESQTLIISKKKKGLDPVLRETNATIRLEKRNLRENKKISYDKYD